MKLQLIPDAKLAWRFDTIQAAAALAVLSVIQAEVLPLVHPLVPAEWWPYITAAVAVLIILLRVRAQPALDAERQQLQLDMAEGSRTAGSDAVDVMIDSKAQYLYRSTNPSKPWSEVSEASKAKWRQVAAAAHEYAIDTMEAR